MQNKGLNTKTGEIVDLFEQGIIDPAPVVFNACKNAISVAASVLTANTIVTLSQQEYAMTPNGPVMI